MNRYKKTTAYKMPFNGLQKKKGIFFPRKIDIKTTSFDKKKIPFHDKSNAKVMLFLMRQIFFEENPNSLTKYC